VIGGFQLHYNNYPIPFLMLTLQFPILVAIFFLSFFADAKPKYTDLEEQVDNLTPERFASFPSRLFFSWFDKLTWKGWKKTLSTEDLWSLAFYNRCASIIPIWDENWSKEKKVSRTKNKPLSILSTLIRCYGSAFGWSCVLNLIYTILQFFSPQLVDKLIGFVDSDEPTWRGYFYIITLIIVTIFNTIVNAQALFVQYEIGLKIKTALISAIYRKSLKLSSNGRREMTVGETTNLMAIDSQRFMDVVPYLNMAWSSPLGESNILFTVNMIVGGINLKVPFIFVTPKSI